MDACAFCSLEGEKIITQNAHAICIRDRFPVAAGHSLIISKRHLSSFFDTSAEERIALMNLLDAAKSLADAEFQPRGYTVGINDGVAAGQTVPHLHIHLIPRFDGDVPDPRGGIRWIIPEKARYWD